MCARLLTERHRIDVLLAPGVGALLSVVAVRLTEKEEFIRIWGTFLWGGGGGVCVETLANLVVDDLDGGEEGVAAAIVAVAPAAVVVGVVVVVVFFRRHCFTPPTFQIKRRETKLARQHLESLINQDCVLFVSHICT